MLTIIGCILHWKCGVWCKLLYAEIVIYRENLITNDELVAIMKNLQAVSDETRAQRIADVLDDDHDGVIDINDALKVMEKDGGK